MIEVSSFLTNKSLCNIFADKIVKEINKLVNLEGMKSWKKVQHTKHFEYDDYIIVTCLNGGTIQQIRTNVIDKIEKLTS